MLSFIICEQIMAQRNRPQTQLQIQIRNNHLILELVSGIFN